MKLEYPYTLEPQAEGGYVVQFVDFAEAFTAGDTLEEAAFNAQEVLGLTLEQRMADKAPLPLPSAAPVNYRASPDAAVQAALLVHFTREAEHMTLAEMARALGTSWPAVQRLENPRHSPTLKQLERAAAALGKRLVLAFE